MAGDDDELRARGRRLFRQEIGERSFVRAHVMRVVSFNRVGDRWMVQREKDVSRLCGQMTELIREPKLLAAALGQRKVGIERNDVLLTEGHGVTTASFQLRKSRPPVFGFAGF